MTFFWFRRDLRLADNAALYHALKSGKPVQCVFIFDTEILDKLPKKDLRVVFLHQQLSRLAQELKALGASLWVKVGNPMDIWREILGGNPAAALYTNHDYEPYAEVRDKAIADICSQNQVDFRSYKDQVIFEKSEILSGSNTPYTVFTPYSKKWKATLNDFYLKSYPCENYFQHFHKAEFSPIPSLESLGFENISVEFPLDEVEANLVQKYAEQRDFPAIKGTSRLGIHLRFGTISIRKLARFALAHSETFLNELIWREFYMQILWHFPHIKTESFKPAYDKIQWRNDKKEFQLWCEGKTGYPLVDAGMRELNATGYMHNRVRMVVASFLTKHLLIDWRWGEAYFAEKLLDFELASNNGGWQWAAGSGCDAAPYFRVFNPEAQQEKFDKKAEYIRKWVKEYGTPLYPKPIVEHKFARERVLNAYKTALA